MHCIYITLDSLVQSLNVLTHLVHMYVLQQIDIVTCTANWFDSKLLDLLTVIAIPSATHTTTTTVIAIMIRGTATPTAILFSPPTTGETVGLVRVVENTVDTIWIIISYDY